MESEWPSSAASAAPVNLADRLAKEATGWRRMRGRRGQLIEKDTDDTAATPDYLRDLKTPLKTKLNRQFLRWQACDWDKETRGRASHIPTPSPTRTILQLHISLHKALGSVINQMRTRKIGQRKFLFQRHVPGFIDTTCKCGRGDQTAQYILFSQNGDGEAKGH
jgi:hypothetical protein